MNTSILAISGISIKQDSHGRFCLNDLHKAAGGEKRHSPNYWLAIQQTKELIEEITKSTTEIAVVEQNQPVITINGGNNRGTFVVKELVYAYATWISAKFFLTVIRAYDSLVNPKPYGLRDQFTCPYANQAQSAPVVERSIEFVTRQQLDKIEEIVRQIELCCKFEGKAKWHIYASLREMFAIEKIADLPSSQFNAAYGHLAVMHEMAKQHLNLLCEADKNFIQSVLRKGRFQLPPQQYGLLA